MRINHNITALNTYSQLAANTTNLSKSMEKLSSGLRINRASDDAVSLTISEKMRGQIRSFDQASRNAQDGISLIQTADGALNETHDILQRMRELATQAANDTYTTTDRDEIQKEINQLTSEINRIGNTTEVNSKKLLNGESMTISLNDMRSVALKISSDRIVGGATTTSKDGAVASYVSTANVTSGSNNTAVEFALDVSTSEKASAAVSIFNDAIEAVSAERSKLGAFQNGLEHTINNLNTTPENLTAEESRIRDVDMAKEMMSYTKSNMLAEAAKAMLAQANQQPQGVLQLLRG